MKTAGLGQAGARKSGPTESGGDVMRSGQSGSGFQESAVQRVCLEAVTKVFERPGGEQVSALSGLSLSVRDQECVALVGPSGSGKTTALRLIAGLEEPTSGTIAIGGTVVNGVPPKERDVAMVFQSPALYPHMTVYENLGFGLRLRKCSRPESDQRIREAAELLGLSPLLGSKPMGLSAGQCQRVALGRAMVRRASVLLLDEPLANVDPSLRAQMRNEIAELRRELGTTMIYVTHDHLEAMVIGDRVAVLRDGALQQADEPRKLYGRPANMFVASFVGSPPMNLFPGALVRQAGVLFFEASVGGPAGAGGPQEFLPVKLAVGSVPHLEGLGRVVMGLRPEQIACVLDKPECPGATIRARLLSIQYVGPDVYLDASSDGNHFVGRASVSSGLTPGQECAFTLDVAKACFFDPVTGKAIL